ncbi:unnamed protein product [Polarella glacialis]|uniref:Uncharacterized protein n=1 Tax=Polarella glacialis TaxID=89957 RepID=A0A813LVV5_POLGL|nr:unnamed protein product [Polarella glacialis]
MRTRSEGLERKKDIILFALGSCRNDAPCLDANGNANETSSCCNEFPVFDADGFAHWYPSGRKHHRLEVACDAVVLALGSVTSWVMVSMILVRSSRAGDSMLKQLGLVVYCIAVLWMLNVSAAWNTVPWKRSWRQTLMFLDGAGIYVMIAGSFTPIVLQCECYKMLALQWAIVAVGMTRLALKVCSKPDNKGSVGDPVQTVGYVLMVLSAGTVWRSLQTSLSPKAFQELMAGVLAYGVGVPIYSTSWLRFNMCVWHIFVLAGSILIYMSIYNDIAGGRLAGTPYA